MSGGYFDYKDDYAKSEIFGYEYDYRDAKKNVFQDDEISELVWDVFGLIHDFDWYKSGDTDEQDYIKSKSDFKKKWFDSDKKTRVKRIIDNRIELLKKQLYKTWDVGENKND